MSTLQQKINDKFIAKLAASREVDAPKIEALQKLLAKNKKPKPDDFVKILSVPVGGDLQ